MQKKRKSPWLFQKVLGSLRHFILLFGAYDRPTLKLIPVLILPLPAVTGYYLSPRHETFIFRPFIGETRRTPRAFATFRIQIPNRQLFRTLTEKLLVTTVTFQISLPNNHLCLESPTSSVGASRTAAPLARAGSCPCGAKRLSHRTVAGAGVQRKHAFVPRWPSN
jgi:hypothetical protein